MTAPFSYGTQWPVYARQWDAMEAVDSNAAATFKKFGENAISNKARYVGVEIDTFVPWMMIAAIHRRESDCNWNTYLGNGQPLNKKTTMVPAGRGPWATWEEGAIDALHYDGLDKVIDWRLEKMIFHLEKYNGLGYYNKGHPSSYCWSQTTIAEPGKYVADGVWDATAVDKQSGCCGVLYAIHRLNPPSQYQRETAVTPWV